MKSSVKSRTGKLEGLLGGLSSRALLVVVGTLFLADVMIADPIPFLDEIFLGVLTILIARWSSRRQEPPPPRDAPKQPPKNVTPPG